MKTLKSLLWLSAFLLCIASCGKEEVTEKIVEVPEGKIPVLTEITVDGVVQTNTRASSEAGYTTGDGLYDSGDKATVSAVANDGYELVRFYDKDGNVDQQDGSSYTFPVTIPQTFKAEFARKYTITVSASPTAGGTVAGGGKYRSGKTCTLTATANAGYVFDGWYEGSTKLSSNTSYSFTVSSNRTITGKFIKETHPVRLFIRFDRNFSGSVIVIGKVIGDSMNFTGSSGEITVEKGSIVKILVERGSLMDDSGTSLPNGGINNIIARDMDNYNTIGESTGKWDVTFTADSDVKVTISCYYGESQFL